MKRLSLLLIAVVFTLFNLGGCSSKNIQKVNVYEMESFSDIKKDSLTSFTDSKVVNDFVKALNNAEKMPGIVDMADPEYKIEFGEESYFLWISEESSTIMNLKDTHTIYTLSKSSVKRVNELLNSHETSVGYVSLFSSSTNGCFSRTRLSVDNLYSYSIKAAG
ncbi:hypothetical protein [Psychrobacillus sp. BM2]|uniref:hypothetical protein n=1 Tax=Psychrobacillus sp. BM2 TaxID=3400421 RepID=UPI003B01B9CE